MSCLLWLEREVREEVGLQGLGAYRRWAAAVWILILPSGEGPSSPGSSAGMGGIHQPPHPLPSSLRSLPRQGGGRRFWGGSSQMHPSPAACAAAPIAGAVSACCLLEREVGEIIVSPREEIWA